jgi:hypothetical protein
MGEEVMHDMNAQQIQNLMMDIADKTLKAQSSVMDAQTITIQMMLEIIKEKDAEISRLKDMLAFNY